MTKFVNKALIAACSVVLTLAVALGAAAPAFADTLASPVQVSDDITRLNVAKLDPDTREYVQGAKMQIINKSTQEVVDEWVSTDETHSFDKGLNVNTRYILREISAPDGYEVASDTEFEVNETQGTGITIISGDDAELTQSYTVNLYDKKKDTETTTTVTKTKNGSTETGDETGDSTSKGNSKSGSTSKTVSPQTGDDAPVFEVAVAVGVCVVAAIVLQVVKRKGAKE